MKITTHNETGEIILYPKIEPTSQPDHTIREVELPTVPEGKRLIWDNDTDGFAFADLPPKPLRQRLKAVTGSFPASLRASFPFERVAYWLDQGDTEAAKAVIEGVDVSDQSQDVQDAKAALLLEFDK